LGFTDALVKLDEVMIQLVLRQRLLFFAVYASLEQFPADMCYLGNAQVQNSHNWSPHPAL